MRYIATLASTIVVLAAGSAQAATLSTPLVGAGTGRVIQCIATNVGRTPATVAVKLYDASGNELVPTSDSCAAMSPIAANASCAVQPPPDQPASCVVQSSGKLRAALEVFDGAGIVAAVPASAR